MTAQWRVRIRGRPRVSPNVQLLVQAVLALAEQLEHERAAPDPPNLPPSTDTPQEDK